MPFPAASFAIAEPISAVTKPSVVGVTVTSQTKPVVCSTKLVMLPFPIVMSPLAKPVTASLKVTLKSTAVFVGSGSEEVIEMVGFVLS